MLTRRALSAVLVVAAAPALAHPHEQLAAEQNGDIERQLFAVRAAIKDAVAAKDVKALRGMYAESFTHTHGSGRVDGRDARVVSLLSGEPVIETAAVSDMTVRVHGPDMAIMTGRSTFADKSGASYETRWMQVYTRASGAWQLAASQATKIAVTS